MKSDAARDMADDVAVAKKRGVETVHSRVFNGEAWSEIVNLLTADRTLDLAVVGTHGRTGLQHVFMGSVAEKIARHAPRWRRVSLPIASWVAVAPIRLSGGGSS